MGKITNALKKATEERLLRLDRLARIKEEERLAIKKMGDSAIDSRVISYFDPKAPITEQYKILRTNLLSLQNSKPLTSVVITSAIHSEGKSITALNLAVTMAQGANKPKVLLIDADLRRGRLAKYLGVQQDTGLTEILEGKAKLAETIFKIDIENLAFIAAGAYPTNPVELLGSDVMKRILSELKDDFDFILVDTPPIIPVTDPGILGTMADGVLMVIQAGRTQRGIVDHAGELLNQAHAKLLGYVLTNIEYHLPEYIYRYI